MAKRPVSAVFDAPTHVFVVLRLTVDRQGQLMNGEVVDGMARSWGRFNSWCGAIRGVQAYLTSLRPAEAVNRS